MYRRSVSMITLLLGVAVAVSAAEGIPYQRVADMLYQVMSADREIYTSMVVQRLTVDEDIITASEHYDDDAALPLPSQMSASGRSV